MTFSRYQYINYLPEIQCLLLASLVIYTTVQYCLTANLGEKRAEPVALHVQRQAGGLVIEIVSPIVVASRLINIFHHQIFVYLCVAIMYILCIYIRTNLV